jgi:hypothetical protein
MHLVKTTRTKKKIATRGENAETHADIQGIEMEKKLG